MIQQHVSLKAFNTFGIEASAKFFSSFSHSDELQPLLASFHQEKLLVLGGGSNILLTQNFDGLVLKNEIKGFQVSFENDEELILKVGAGEVWHDFVLFCIAAGYAGVENLSLIPGSVGASPMQNIGAYGVEVKDVFDHLEAYHIETGELVHFDRETCRFGYRESIFKNTHKNQYIICHVAFRLQKNAKINTSYGAIESELERMGIKNASIRDVSQAVINIRQRKLPDPKKIGNAGSFFKNPVIAISQFNLLKQNYPDLPAYPVDASSVKIPAGWLIEKAGWKGKKFDHFGVHPDQALVLVNYTGATGNEIWELSSAIKADILKKFNVDLEREVNVI